MEKYFLGSSCCSFKYTVCEVKNKEVFGSMAVHKEIVKAITMNGKWCFIRLHLYILSNLSLQYPLNIFLQLLKQVLQEFKKVGYECLLGHVVYILLSSITCLSIGCNRSYIKVDTNV